MDSTQVVAIATDAGKKVVEQSKDNIHWGVWLTFLTLIVLAIQVWVNWRSPIKAVEIGRKLNEEERKLNSKKNLFLTLFAHRGQNVNPYYVNALNQIDVVYSDTPLVLRAWHNLYDALSDRSNSDQTDERVRIETDARWNNLRMALLTQMAFAVGYNLQSLDPERLGNPSYSPVAHGTEEEQQRLLRDAAIQYFQSGHSTHEIAHDYYDAIIQLAKTQKDDPPKK